MSNVSELTELLELAKSIATSAGQRLVDGFTRDHRTYVHCHDHPKEIKAVADTVLERDILGGLAPTGLSILSEESGYIPAKQTSTYWFIVDPLDGTFNFVKGLGPCAVSIALWDDQKPIFGVIYDLTERQLVWGGAGMGAYADGQRVSVSETSSQARASICTGFPARFDVARDHAARVLEDSQSLRQGPDAWLRRRVSAARRERVRRCLFRARHYALGRCGRPCNR